VREQEIFYRRERRGKPKNIIELESDCSFLEFYASLQQKKMMLMEQTSGDRCREVINELHASFLCALSALCGKKVLRLLDL
jgi:hypothetical protein